MNKSIDTLVPDALGALDENSQLGAVEAALKALANASRDLTPLQKTLVTQDAAQRLRELDLGTKATVDAAFAAIFPVSADDSQMWVADVPWPEPVSLAEVLESISTKVRQHMVMTQEQADIIALWTAYTYIFNSFDIAPYLAITSATKRCGKTTLFSIIERVVYQPFPTGNATPAAIFRSVEKWHPTLLLDEMDTYVHGKAELIGILNSGHTRTGAHVTRCVGEDHDPKRFSTWAPKVYALIGQLPTTLEDRSVVVRLKRKTRVQRTERTSIISLERDFAQHIRRMLTRWAADTTVSGELMPEPPPELNDRAADNWRPLLAVATDAGEEWVSRALRAAVDTKLDEDEDELTMLLRDMKEVFAEHGDFVPSETVIGSLQASEERPWGHYRYGKPINPHQLAQLLKPVGIKPRKHRIAKATIRGYFRSEFEGAFVTYVPVSRNESEQPEQSPQSEHEVLVGVGEQ